VIFSPVCLLVRCLLSCLTASQLPARLLVLLAGMIPVPGETSGHWWSNTGCQQAAQEQARLDGRQDRPRRPAHQLLQRHTGPLAEEALRRGGRGESSVVWDTPWPLDAWPDVPTKFILCQDDQFFPGAFLRQVAQQRLGIIPDEVPGCHCVALSHPQGTQQPSPELPRLTADRRGPVTAVGATA
jgi:hypothetical protein